MEKINVDIIGVESATVYGQFDEAIESLTKNGYEIISLIQNAQLRIQQGKDAYISQNENWVKEGVLYVPRGKNKLVRNSPILESVKKATQAHNVRREFYPTREQIEQSLTDSIDFPEKIIKIPTNRFNSEDLAVYALGGENEARAYGEFLNDAGIKEMFVHAVDKDDVYSQSKPFVRQLMFRDLDRGSCLFSDMGIGGRFRGVKVVTS